MGLSAFFTDSVLSEKPSKFPVTWQDRGQWVVGVMIVEAVSNGMQKLSYQSGTRYGGLKTGIYRDDTCASSMLGHDIR